MINLLRYVFPIHRVKYTNKAIKVLIISDTIFFSGMALVEVVFSVFIVSKIAGASVVNVGVGNAIFMLGVLISEPFISKYYDVSRDVNSAFHGFLFGNLLKSAFRLIFVFISSINMFYVVYFVLVIVHSIEYPAFAKIFSQHLDKGYESSDWGIKDIFMSLGKLLTFFVSGYIAVIYGYNALFILSAIIMFLFGFVLPLVYRKEFIQV